MATPEEPPKSPPSPNFLFISSISLILLSLLLLELSFCVDATAPTLTVTATGNSVSHKKVPCAILLNHNADTVNRHRSEVCFALVFN